MSKIAFISVMWHSRFIEELGVEYYFCKLRNSGMTRVLDDINRMNYLFLLKFLNTSAKGKEESFISNRQLNSTFKRAQCQVLGKIL